MKKVEKIDFLLGLYIAAVVASELMGAKTFTVGFLTASVAIFVFPLTYVINDVVIETAGKERAISFMRAGMKILLFLMAFNLLAVALPASSRFAPSSDAYNHVFSKSLRMTLASLVAFYLSEKIDILIFAKIRQRLKKSGLWLRSNVSNIVSQFFDTTIFMFLAFYSGDNFFFVWKLIIPYWMLKSLFSIMETPFAYWGVAWVNKEAKNKGVTNEK